jgi:amidohydrolase
MTGRAFENFPADELADMVALRRDLHRHPELRYEETRTAEIVAARLSGIGLRPRTGIAKTGVTADMGSSGGARLMIRADMDGLPLQEDNPAEYASEEPGRMHACGHDGHVAIGLAVARRLAERPPSTPIRSLFQPAEEGGNGAEAMCRDGALENVSAALGLHLWNLLPVGKIGVVPGPQMAAVDEFEILVSGPGGHAAAPDETFDPILASARIVEALQAVVSREISPLDPAVVTVGSIHGGSAFNIIPKQVVLKGTVRTFSAEAHRSIPEKLGRIVAGTAQACGVSARLDYRRLNRATINDPAMTRIVVEAAEEILGPGCVAESRTMGGEDMSVYLEKVPGCFFFVGSALPGPPRPHHSPVFDFDERALAVGALVLEAAARKVSERIAR